MIPFAYGVFQKVRHLNLDWWALGLLLVLSLLSPLLGWLAGRRHTPSPSNNLPDAQPNVLAFPFEHANERGLVELKNRALSIAGSACALLFAHGEPVGSIPEIDRAYGGLANPPDDPAIAREFASDFASKVSDLKSDLGKLGVLAEPCEFSSVGDVLGGGDVRNANDVRRLIRCLVHTSGFLKERYVTGKPFALVSSREHSFGYASTTEFDLKTEVIQITKGLRRLLQEVGPEPPLVNPQSSDAAEMERVMVEYTQAKMKWVNKLSSRYMLNFADRMRVVCLRLREHSPWDNSLDRLKDGVGSTDDVETCITSLNRIVLHLE